MEKNANNTTTVLTELRNKVEGLKTKTKSINQAVKACQGIATEPELEALNIASFSLKNVKDAWADSLKVVGSDGKDNCALYMWETLTESIPDGKGGEKKVTVYEQVKNEKKGTISYRSLRVRVLKAPEAWGASDIIEGLCQSVFPKLAKQESDESFAYAAKVKHYQKVTKKDEEGNINVTFVEL